MSDKIKKILIVGDNHLSSSNRSNHTDYARESLDCLKEIQSITESEHIDYYVDLGDISYGKFELSYRAEVEKVYEDRFKSTNGNIISARGNHDISNKNISEWEYYTKHRKIINNCECLHSVSEGYRYFDTLNIRWHIIDFGHEDVKLEIGDGMYNIVCAHNFFKFSDTNIANYGTAIELDYKEDWFGIDLLIVGHIHKNTMIKGTMKKDGKSKEVMVYYPGSIVRTDFIKDLPECGTVVMVTARDGEEPEITLLDVPWIPQDEAFQIGDIIKEKKKINIDDVVAKLNDTERNVGDPEVAVRNLTGFKQEYKDKALELLRDYAD